MAKVAKAVVSPFAAVFGTRAALQFAAVAVNFIPGIGQLASLAISTALTIGSKFIAKKRGPATSPSNRDRLISTINPRAPRTIVFGTTAMANDIRDQEFTGTNQEYLHRFIVVAAHKVNSITKITFDDKVAWTLAGGVQGEYVGYLTVAPILEGSAANAINISARMGSTRRYTGLAYVHLRFKLTGNSKKAESPFSSSIPSRVTIEGDGISVYDPRQDSTVAGGSGSHRADDQSTWTFGTHARNPALQALTYLLGWRINGILSVGKGIPSRRFNMQSFITAANVCDETVALSAGGTEPRYRFDDVFSEGDDMSLVLGQFATSMDARFYDPQGSIEVKCIVNDLGSPVASFGPADILGEVQWTPFAELADNYNIVRGTHTDASPTSLYQAVEYPQQSVASVDGIERVLTLDLPGVNSASQAQRIAYRALMRAQHGGGTLSCEMQATAWRVQQLDALSLTFPALGFTNKIFRVEEIEARVDGTVPIVLSAEDSRIYDWAAADVAAITPVATTPYIPGNNPLVQGITESSFSQAIVNSYIDNLVGSFTGADEGATASITIPDHDRIYPAPFASVAVTGSTIGGLAYATTYYIYYDDPPPLGGAVTYVATTNSADAYASATNPDRHYVASRLTVASGGGGGGGGGVPPWRSLL